MNSSLSTTRLLMAALALFAVFTAQFTGSSARAAAWQDNAERSVWSGVYTEEQSKRGERVYTDTCAMCHASELTGGQVVPPLVGDDFLAKWNGSMVGDLFEQIRMTMPQDNPGSLSPSQYADVVAYILKKNRFPVGQKDLDGEFDALKTIRIEPSRKPGRERSFASTSRSFVTRLRGREGGRA